MLMLFSNNILVLLKNEHIIGSVVDLRKKVVGDDRPLSSMGTDNRSGGKSPATPVIRALNRLYHRRRFHVPWRSGSSLLYFQ